MDNTKRTVTAYAPATVSNICSGYDIFGFAIHNPGDTVTISFNNTSENRIIAITGKTTSLPTQFERNTAGFSVLEYMRHLGIKSSDKKGIDISIDKNMPIGSGLGSSAASAAAALVAINELFGNLLTKKELIPFAMLSEKLACGSAHADNVAPALLGGFTLIRSYNPLDVISLPFPENIICIVIHPDIIIKTYDARSILPKNIPLTTAVKQWANAAGLVAGLCLNDINLLSNSLIDHIIEPVRAKLMPYYNDVKQAALNAGALGCGISGSGPSMFALSTDETISDLISSAMQKAVNTYNLQSQVYVSRINTKGTILL